MVKLQPLSTASTIRTDGWTVEESLVTVQDDGTAHDVSLLKLTGFTQDN